jgi:hypothetical protein
VADLPSLEVINLIDTVQKKYPRLAPFLDIPQVGKLVLLLAGEKIEQDEFERRLRNTRYWKKTSESQRRWRILKYQDPATARRRIDGREATVRDLVRSLGVQLPRNVNIRRISEWSLRNDWTEEEMTDHVLSYATFRDEGAGRPGGARFEVPPGAIGTTVLQLRDLARQYMIDPSARQQFNDATRILTGSTTIENMAASYTQRAIQRWGSNVTLRNHLAQGGTMEEFFDPYKEMISEELELPADGVDLRQTRWEEILNTATSRPRRGEDPNSFGFEGTREFRPMTLSEAREWVRKRPEWLQTRNAKSLASSAVEELGRRFGQAA